MAVADQCVTEKFAIYNADCMSVMQGLPDASVHLSVYSPPFASGGVGGLYVYSSDPRDLSNCDSYEGFFEQYTFIVRELARIAWTCRAATAAPTATSTSQATSSSFTSARAGGTPADT
jgi:hypothetical protein